MSELAKAISNHHESGTLFTDLAELKNSGDFINEALLKSIFDNSIPDRKDSQFVYSKLQKNPHLRKSLSSLNTAKSFVYGSRAFGQQSWYKETFNVCRSLHSNAERRKFRFGLKSNIDFLIQLDIQNLKTILADKKFEPQNLSPHNYHPQLSDGSFLNTLSKVNHKRYLETCEIIERIAANLEFTQSLGEYFANDDMLEPALMLIADALRKGPNLLKTLHGGSVASNALIYRNRAAVGDHDAKAVPKKIEPRKKQMNEKYTYKNSAFSENKQQLKFKMGYCFRFQYTNACQNSDCPYNHICHQCDSAEHGYKSCPKR